MHIIPPVEPARTDAVFKTLADPTRRRLLDLLHADNGQKLGALCAHLEMSRQAATQHLDLLEAANLISTVRRGREKLHYLNPVPIHEIQARWIEKFEQPRLHLLTDIKGRLENQLTPKPAFVYVIYIATTAEKLWQALTDPDLTAQYWDDRNVSDWKVGSSWEHRAASRNGPADGTVLVVGTILESDPPRRLVNTWALPGSAGVRSKVSFDIEPVGDSVRLTVTHEDLDEAGLADASSGWAAVLSSLKSFVETGRAMQGLW